MTRMLRTSGLNLFTFAFAACLVVSLALPVRAQDAPAPSATMAPAAVPANPATMAAAVELMDVIGASKNFDNMLAMLKTHVTTGAGDGPAAKDTADAFAKLVDKFSTYKKQMLDETAALYAAKFTAAELKAVTEFYKSGAGVKFIAEMPDLMDQAGGVGQKFAVQMMKDLKDAKETKETK